MSKRADKPHPVFLKEKATGNHALDSYAYGRWPHLFNVLALKYPVPPEMLLTLLFLWDRTVGDGDDAGDCARTQIPVRARHRDKWLSAFVAGGFFSCEKSESGGSAKRQRGSFFIYKNPTADQWDQFFWRASILSRFEHWDDVLPNKFAALFEDITEPRAGGVMWALWELIGKGQQRAKETRKRKCDCICTGMRLPYAADGVSVGAERTHEKGLVGAEHTHEIGVVDAECTHGEDAERTHEIGERGCVAHPT